MSAAATLNGQRVLKCRVNVSAYGVPWFAVETGGDAAISGATTLVLDDVTFKGTVITGGTNETRARHIIAGGAGGWGKTVPAKPYANDAGVKYSTILGDVARECGETMGTIPSGTAGPAFVRAEGPASRVLDEFFPKGWYVDENGVTQIGKRATATYTGAAARTRVDAALGTIELAPTGIATLRPGAVVDGVEAVDVEHVLDGTLRTTIWGKRAGRTGDPVLGAISNIVEALTDKHRYFAPWEYRVVQRTGERLVLQIVRVSSGMPNLENVRIRPGVAGLRMRPKLGSLVIVSFVNGDPARPIVTAFDDAESPGFVGEDLYLQAGSAGTTAGVTEHATSAEATVLAIQQMLVYVGAQLTAGGDPAGAVLTAASTDVGMAAIVATIAAASVGVTTSGAINTALAAKTADTTGRSPNLGWPHVRGG